MKVLRLVGSMDPTRGGPPAASLKSCIAECVAALAKNPGRLELYAWNARKGAEAKLSYAAHGAALGRCYDRLVAG